MSDFTISLAGIPIGISSISPQIQEFFADYLTSDPPLFSVVTTETDIEREWENSDKNYSEESINNKCRFRYNFEKMFLLRSIADKIPEHNVILVHGAVVAVNGKCYMFTAPSGTGKTTHVKLWLAQLPQAYVLNGDKPFLKITDEGKVLACGVPYRGKECMGCNEMLPLEAICILDRSPKNKISTEEPRSVIGKLLRQTHVPKGTEAMMKTIQLLDKIVQRVRLYHLECNMDPEAAEVSIGAMLCKND